MDTCINSNSEAGIIIDYEFLSLSMQGSLCMNDNGQFWEITNKANCFCHLLGWSFHGKMIVFWKRLSSKSGSLSLLAFLCEGSSHEWQKAFKKVVLDTPFEASLHEWHVMFVKSISGRPILRVFGWMGKTCLKKADKPIPTSRYSSPTLRYSSRYLPCRMKQGCHWRKYNAF